MLSVVISVETTHGIPNCLHNLSISGVIFRLCHRANRKDSSGVTKLNGRYKALLLKNMCWIWFRPPPLAKKKVNGNDAVIGLVYCRYPGNVAVRQGWNKVRSLCILLLAWLVDYILRLFFSALMVNIHQRDKKNRAQVHSSVRLLNHANCSQTKNIYINVTLIDHSLPNYARFLWKRFYRVAWIFLAISTEDAFDDDGGKSRWWREK